MQQVYILLRAVYNGYMNIQKWFSVTYSNSQCMQVDALNEIQLTFKAQLSPKSVFLARWLTFQEFWKAAFNIFIAWMPNAEIEGLQ